MLRHTKTVALAALSILLGLSVVSPAALVKAEIGVTNTALISATPTGEPGNDQNVGPILSSSGRFVAFTSQSTNLISDLQLPPNAGLRQTYVYDRQLQTMELVSRSTSGEIADSNSSALSISADGRFVLISSQASNLTQDPPPTPPDQLSFIYLHDRQANTTIRIAPTFASVQASTARMSDDASTIVFTGRANQADVFGIFIYSHAAGITSRITDGSSVLSISADGRYISYNSGGQAYRYDSTTDEHLPFATNVIIPTGGGPILSPDGTHALYYYQSGNSADIYLENIESEHQHNIATDIDSVSYLTLSVSADNKFVTYRTTPIEGDPPTPLVKIWVADVSTGQKILVDTSRRIGVTPQVTISADGTQVAFSALKLNNLPHVFVSGLGELDDTAPMISDAAFSSNPKSTNETSVELSAQVTDDLSGVASVEYYDPVQEAWLPMAVNGSTATATVETPTVEYPAGTYEFVVRATDEAGNETTAPVHLYIYNPASNTLGLGSITPGGPTSDPGDNLPALPGSPTGQFTFAVTYGGGTSPTPTGTSAFTYGTACILPWSNCFRMTTNSFDWLIVNGNTATFQGTASLTLGNQSPGSDFVVRATATNGTNGAADHYLLQLYEQGSNPETDTPLYQASGDATGLVLVF